MEAVKMRGTGFLALLCGFGLFGHASNQRIAEAAIVPKSCPQYECRTVHAAWDGNPTAVFAHFTAGSKGTINDSFGITNIFTDTSVEKKPQVNDGTNAIDAYSFASCTPHCGKDANGVWLATQSVTELGAGQAVGGAQNVQKMICTTGQATAIFNPVNGNTNKNSPPGWK